MWGFEVEMKLFFLNVVPGARLSQKQVEGEVSTYNSHFFWVRRISKALL